ncbi:hypothetical protein Amsp01_042890 [Amycolatopsis sp. NBRC 101858]|uniref:nucleotide exchange factor GrpE n=1 Tax=Amycolatopsis sp. NBRC 101858 TaxID=3032200 RepID=UPI0024A522BE|nr:nucleotide exchange factor GrpE [Amycolatopsis sp. NBRC 101858]GLY38265.1 hypothetical protein Amsp01_042890 [Amycolatopsis sp. NBRC 101858]
MSDAHQVETAERVLEEPPGSAEPAEPRALGPDPVVAEAIASLAEQIRGHHVRAEARERVIDQLHAELIRLRAGEQGVVLRPVVTDLQNLRGEIVRQVRTLPAEMSREQVIRLLESFALDVELALERCGIVPFRPRVGEKFSGREHRAVKVVEAASAEEDGTIADVLADGYQDVATGRLAAPAKVCVRRRTEQSLAEPAAEPVHVNEHELEERTDG